MTLPLDGLDFDVIAPADVPLTKLAVVDAAHSISGHDVDQDHWWRISLAPADDNSATAPVVDTTARLGVRPTGPTRVGATTLDDTLTSVAAHAVHSHLTSGWTNLTPSADLEAWGEDLHQRAQRIATALRNEQVWTRTTAVVAGKDYALWVHRTGEGFAACADLGYALLTVHGVKLPSAFVFQRLTPAQTVAAFT
jgi:hypothetical protein